MGRQEALNAVNARAAAIRILVADMYDNPDEPDGLGPAASAVDALIAHPDVLRGLIEAFTDDEHEEAVEPEVVSTTSSVEVRVASSGSVVHIATGETITVSAGKVFRGANANLTPDEARKVAASLELLAAKCDAYTQGQPQ